MVNEERSSMGLTVIFTNLYCGIVQGDTNPQTLQARLHRQHWFDAVRVQYLIVVYIHSDFYVSVEFFTIIVAVLMRWLHI